MENSNLEPETEKETIESEQEEVPFEHFQAESDESQATVNPFVGADDDGALEAEDKTDISNEAVAPEATLVEKVQAWESTILEEEKIGDWEAAIQDLDVGRGGLE